MSTINNIDRHNQDDIQYFKCKAIKYNLLYYDKLIFKFYLLHEFRSKYKSAILISDHESSFTRSILQN